MSAIADVALERVAESDGMAVANSMRAGLTQKHWLLVSVNAV
jgi:hypothetical protein